MPAIERRPVALEHDPAVGSTRRRPKEIGQLGSLRERERDSSGHPLPTAEGPGSSLGDDPTSVTVPSNFVFG